MKKICLESEKEIITNYELFGELAEGVFGRLAESKILDPIKKQIGVIGKENIQQEKIINTEKSMKILIADDESEILELYKVFLESKGKEPILTTDGKKCIDAYKKDFEANKTSSFDLVILDQNSLYDRITSSNRNSKNQSTIKNSVCIGIFGKNIIGNFI